MTHYYINPNIAVSGNGLTFETGFKHYGEIPVSASTADGHTIHLPADVPCRPRATLPTNPETYNIGVPSPYIGNNVTFTVDGVGKGILLGAVLWTGAVTNQSLNGINCVVLQHDAVISPFWFPRSDGVASFPSVCAPSALGVDQFLADPYAVDDITPGQPGFRYVPSTSYGHTTNFLKEVSYVSLAALGTGTGYDVYFRDVFGFWARAAAVGPLEGYPVVMRMGTNFTGYFGRITDYDPDYDYGDGGPTGRVTMHSTSAPYGGTSSIFFYALVAHPYGVRKAQQYAMTADQMGWIAALPTGAVMDVACFSTALYCQKDNITLDPTKTFRFEAGAHGNDDGRAGYGLLVDSGVAGVTYGNVEMHQWRNYSREGGAVGGVGSGSVTNVTGGGTVETECLGVKGVPWSVSGASGPITITGPIVLRGNGGSLRVAGEVAGLTIRDSVSVPSVRVHDNASNYYQGCRDCEIEGFVLSGQVNPHAQQWNSLNFPTDANRRLKNGWLSGRRLKDNTDWQTSGIIRHDNGNTNGLYDRIVAVHGSQNFFGGKESTQNPTTLIWGGGLNTGMRIRRCVLDKVGRTVATAFSGVILEHVVMCKQNGTLTLAALAAEGATFDPANVIMLPNEFASYGGLTAQMWAALTSDLAGGYEDIDEWLAPQLGLTLRAFGSTRTLIAPALVAGPLRVGHQPGLTFGEFMSPNPLAVMSLPVGVEDNAKVKLHNATQLTPVVEVPQQDKYVIALDLTDVGAENGPTQRFYYEIGIGTDLPDVDPPPDPDPPPVVIRGSSLRMRLRGRLLLP